jgi:hypothetical protein
MRKQKRPPPAYRNPRPEATNNYFAPLRDLPMANTEPGSEENFSKIRETNESSRKDTPTLIILTSEPNLVSLQRELTLAVSGEFFFRSTETGIRITTERVVDNNGIHKFFTEKNLNFFTFYTMAN